MQGKYNHSGSLLKKRIGEIAIEVLFYIVIILFWLGLAGYHAYEVYYYGQPDVKAEIQLKECAKKIGFGNKFIVVEPPVSDETAKLLKEEHYEVYKEFKEEQGVVYKKNDKK